MSNDGSFSPIARALSPSNTGAGGRHAWRALTGASSHAASRATSRTVTSASPTEVEAEDSVAHLSRGPRSALSMARSLPGIRRRQGNIAAAAAAAAAAVAVEESENEGGGKQDIFGRAALHSHRAFEPGVRWHSPSTAGTGDSPGGREVSVAAALASEAAAAATAARSAWLPGVVFGDGDIVGETASVTELISENRASRLNRFDNVDFAPVRRRRRREPSRIAVVCAAALAWRVVQACLSLLTITVLFCSDLIVYSAEVRYDELASGMLWLCLAVFALEWGMLVASSELQRPRYNGSFFFFMDLIAVLSILVDILLIEANNLQDRGPVARAARTAKFGSRAGRSLRLLRLLRNLRLVRISRFIKALIRRRDEKARKVQTPSSDEFLSRTGSTEEMRAESVGAQIGAKTTKKIVVITLLFLIGLPLGERVDDAAMCNSELVVLLEKISQSNMAQGNCSQLEEALSPWFMTGVVPFSRSPDTGFSQRGMIYARICGCVLYRDESLLGDGPGAPNLWRVRRASELHALRCDVRIFDDDSEDLEQKSPNLLVYDFRSEEIDAASATMATTACTIAVLLGFALAFSTGAEGFAGQLVTPLLELMESMNVSARLELDKAKGEGELSHSSVFEIHMLQQTYAQLHAAVASFVKFMPTEVVRHFVRAGREAKLGVRPRDVCIFFSDIAGFDGLCDRYTPTEVLSLLSDYFDCMVSIIIEEEGTMLEFIGDSILAIWNAPTTVERHTIRTITAALRQRTALKPFVETWKAKGKPPLRTRIGLHSANVFVGNLGSRLRMKYGVLGDGVNLAARVENLNKRYGTDIVISEDVRQQEGVQETFLLRTLDNVCVKGRLLPTMVYEVLGERKGSSSKDICVATLSEMAMQAYLRRDFREALAHLDEVKALKGGRDRAGTVLSERCRRFLVHPPADNWDGSEVLAEKTWHSEHD